MGCTINGWGVMRADIVIASRGVWTADVEPIDDADVAAGAAVSIVAGDLTLSGTVLRGSMGVANSSFFILGGSGGLRKTLTRRPYYDDAGIRLVDVVRDIAAESGEQIDVDSSLSSKMLGGSWVRPECTASEALSAISADWRVLPSGRTFVGPMAQTEATGIVSMRAHMASIGRTVVDLPDEEFSSIVPGAVIDLGEFSIVSRVARIIVSRGSMWAEVDE